MGIYKRMNQSCGTQSDLYASVKDDGSKAVVHGSFGTKVYKRVDDATVDEDLWLSIKSNPKLTVRDLIPYIDALGNYIFLTNKPKINGVTLEGDKTSEELQIYGQVNADGVFFNDGETLQEKYDNGDLGVNKYPDLKEKPTINGIVLNGDLTSASLGIVDDENLSTVSAWSSVYIQKKLDEVSVTAELIGTDEQPVIASELKMGSYIISGKMRSSLNNATTIRVPRKHYIINRDIDDVTVLWDANPYTKTQYYIVFKHEGIEEPSSHTIEILTKDQIQGTVESILANAELDCGGF